MPAGWKIPGEAVLHESGKTLKALPVLSRRLRLAVGLPYLLLAIAAGKCAGSLYYFLYGIGRQ